MKPEHYDQFRKDFILRDMSNDPHTPLDDMYDSGGKPENVRPLTFGKGIGKLGFTVGMSQCIWRQ